MICAYCGKEAKGTKEHIISSGILGLFPECFATIDGERSIVHQGDPMVKDVCADCNNNRISYIDSYAKEFIEKYFLVKYKKDDTLSVEYDYTMIQKMCLKFAFNDLRARKKEVSFFDDEVKEFLLNEEKSSPLGNITILAGLAVNTSPAPDYMFGNMNSAGEIRHYYWRIVLSQTLIIIQGISPCERRGKYKSLRIMHYRMYLGSIVYSFLYFVGTEILRKMYSIRTT
ncbi:MULTISPECIES: hypothetical protein [unclassified Blautia]|uniref:hypothetical protein n=1 Tax=unclassified Blautia TaxID=2648079 RepID=UPI001FAA2436|nr:MULTISPECIES: hypothetical protein [unclassified Blautia]